MRKLILIAIVAAFAACDKNDEPTEPNSNCNPQGVSFAADVAPIIQQNCAVSGCHTGSSPAGGTTFGSYSEVSAKSSEIRSRINLPSSSPSIMPPTGSLDDCDIKTITKWIDEGAINN